MQGWLLEASLTLVTLLHPPTGSLGNRHHVPTRKRFRQTGLTGAGRLCPQGLFAGGLQGAQVSWEHLLLPHRDESCVTQAVGGMGGDPGQASVTAL